MKLKLLSASALALLALAPAVASAQFVVDFEKQWDYLNGDVNGYYAGGTAADGTSGADLGVSFVNVSGLSNDPGLPDFPYYSGAPSMLGTAYAHTFAPEDRAFMNVASGVEGALSFFYSTPAAVIGAISAYSGLNGTGTLLGTFDLAANASGAYDAWSAATFSFGGIAHSFDLTASANLVGLDDISASVTPVPEPSTMLLMLIGGAAVLNKATRRRRDRA